MTRRPSPAQIDALAVFFGRRERQPDRDGTYAPPSRERRSFEACEDRGWVRHVERRDGFDKPGYIITEQGAVAYRTVTESNYGVNQ